MKDKAKMTSADFEALAESGDFDDFIKAAHEIGLDCQSHKERFRQLRMGVRKLKCGVPELIDLAFDHALRFDIPLLMRYQLQADHMLAFEGSRVSPAHEEPGPLTKAWLDRVQHLQDRLIWMAEKYARIQHLLGMKEKKVPKNVQKLAELRESLHIVNRETG